MGRGRGADEGVDLEIQDREARIDRQDEFCCIPAAPRLRPTRALKEPEPRDDASHVDLFLPCQR